MTKQTNKPSRGIYAVLGIALVSLAIVALGGVYYYKQAKDYKNELHNTYMRSFHDMADYLSDIDVGLKKTMLAGDASQLSTLSSQLYMQAEAAKSCLSQMPTENASFDNVSKFLSQVGDYASYLSRRMITEGEVSEEEFDNLASLSDYAEAVSEEFSDMEQDVYNNTMQIEALSVFYPNVVHADGGDFASGMEQIESLPQAYPSLIYDGPFSEHLNTAQPTMLRDASVVSRATAESVISMFIGEERASKIAYESDGSGDIATYLYSGTVDDRTISMELTKQGGKVLWMLDTRSVQDERLSVEQAMRAGELFLTQRGYPSMKSSYYDVADHIATINYAYSEHGVTMYPDLIKVKIALDNGEILGFESQGFLMCHREREIPQTVIGEERAREKAGKHLSVDTVSMAYIPLESKREVYCYEIKGTLGKNNFLVYINAETGQEEKILMLQESENGILTI